MKPTYKKIVSFVEKNGDIFRKPVKKHKLVTRFVDEYGLSVKEVNVFFLAFREIMKNESSVYPDDIRTHFKYSFEEYIDFLNTLNSLKDKGMLIFNEYNNVIGTNFNPSITLDELLFQKFVFDKDPLDNCKLDDPYSIIEYITELLVKRKKEELSTLKLYEEIDRVLKKVDHTLEAFVQIRSYNDTQRAILFTVASDYLNGNNSLLTAQSISEQIIDNTAERMRLFTTILDMNLQIIKDNYIYLDSILFVENPMVKLTQQGASRLFNLKQQKKVKKIECELTKHIKHKTLNTQLFFPQKFHDEISKLHKALEPKRFKALLKELQKNNHSKSFVSLFYGLAGTGKTASVYEIASKTKRDVLQVNIEKIRDKYVGESEKRLAQIFEEYNEAKKVLKHTPILLFNEADALLGQRIGISNSVDQMNNSMQNILLQNLENFEGIFIATTNLIDNMDDAFSRRFLYKLEFPKPTRETRLKIWAKKLPNLSKDIYVDISRYELTGAQIEVIAKQFFIRNFLEAKEDTLSILRQMILSELSYKSEKTKLGFLV